MPANFITVRQAAHKWKLSTRRVQKYCEEGRIPGAELVGGRWLILKPAKRPRIYKPNGRKGGK